jgi:deazaflavin-dependent oxidoreductase (nitroreductase family)
VLSEDLVTLPYCYVTTIGRVSDEPHEIEIWFGASPGRERIYLLSGGGARSDWVKNLRANPSVHLRIGERAWDTTAYVVDDPAEETLARELLSAKYQGWRAGQPRSDWATTALPVAIVTRG